MLPPNDVEYLKDKAPNHQVRNEGGVTCVVIPAYVLPKGFDCPSADLLLRLAPGYPDVQPDMWWFDPPVRRVDGREFQQRKRVRGISVGNGSGGRDTSNRDNGAQVLTYWLATSR